MAPIFNWPPFKLVELNADTGKPTDPNIGMRVRREFYDVKRDGRGKKVIVAHKTGGGSSKQEDTKEPVKNEGSEQNKVDGERKEKNGEGGGNQVPVVLFSKLFERSLTCLAAETTQGRMDSRRRRETQSDEGGWEDYERDQSRI